MNDSDRILRCYILIRLIAGSLILGWCLGALSMSLLADHDGLPGRRVGGGTRYTTEIQP